MLFYGSVNLCECWCGLEAKEGNRFIHYHYSRVQTQESKEKNRQSNIGLHAGEKSYWYGKHQSEESKEKSRLSHLGKKASEETCKKRSISLLGHKVSEESKLKMSVSKIGVERSEESKKKQSESLKGEKNWNWKGEITPENIKIRNSDEYKQWRKEVFKRDNYTCHKCRVRGGKIQVHHIVNFPDVIKDENKLWNTDNGLTFCKKCHKKFHRRFGRKDNIPQQLFAFIYLQNY